MQDSWIWWNAMGMSSTSKGGTFANGVGGKFEAVEVAVRESRVMEGKLEIFHNYFYLRETSAVQTPSSVSLLLNTDISAITAMKYGLKSS